MSSQHDPAADATVSYGPGVEDLVIVPLVAVAFALARFVRALLRLLVHLIDWLFPILLQIMRFPLFTLRIVGDGIAALLKAVAWVLPMGGDRRSAWRALVSRQWTWLRQKLSYHAFEMWLHHAFENGMAFVFRRCRTLTPRAALLVIVGAVLWLPISFGTATALHALLFAKALVWPAWLQLLHPLATIIAKSKLLVLPVYPAAWPQAKRHPLVQALLGALLWLRTLYLVRKAVVRYGQIAQAASIAHERLAHTSAAIGLTRLGNTILGGVNNAAECVGVAARRAALGSVALLSRVPLLGPIMRRYAEQYDASNRGPAEPLSERTRHFFARWSVKFTAAYYEARERDLASGHEPATRPTA